MSVSSVHQQDRTESHALPDPWTDGRETWTLARGFEAGPKPENRPAADSASKLSQIEASLKKDVKDLVQQQMQAVPPPPGLQAQDQRLLTACVR